MSKKKLYCVYHDISQDLPLNIVEVGSKDEYCHGFIIEDDGGLSAQLEKVWANHQEIMEGVEKLARAKWDEQNPDDPLVEHVTFVGSCL